MNMIKSTFELEDRLIEEGYAYIIGIDEAGRGPLAGPVVACAAMMRNHQSPISNNQINPKSQIPNLKSWELVRDSKTLSEKQREKMFDFIQEHFHVGVGICDHKTIDRINILEASFLAMKKAVADLIRIKHKDSKFIILIDGNKPIPNISMDQKAIVNGDKYVKSISAASIIAKVTRDRIMREMHKKYPMYGFDRHKGYGTRLHMELIKELGSCEIHRQSFEPLKSLAKRKKKVILWRYEFLTNY